MHRNPMGYGDDEDDDKNVISKQAESKASFSPTHSGHYFTRSMFGGVSALVGFNNGIHGGAHIFAPANPFLLSLAVGGTSTIAAKIASQYGYGNPNQEADKQAAIAGISAGLSSLSGWAAIRYFGSKSIYEKDFTRAMGLRRVFGVGLASSLISSGLVYLGSTACDKYKNLDGSKFNEKMRFSFFKNNSAELKPIQIEKPKGPSL